MRSSLRRATAAAMLALTLAGCSTATNHPKAASSQTTSKPACAAPPISATGAHIATLAEATGNSQSGGEAPATGDFVAAVLKQAGVVIDRGSILAEAHWFGRCGAQAPGPDDQPRVGNIVFLGSRTNGGYTNAGVVTNVSGQTFSVIGTPPGSPANKGAMVLHFALAVGSQDILGYGQVASTVIGA